MNSSSKDSFIADDEDQFSKDSFIEDPVDNSFEGQRGRGIEHGMLEAAETGLNLLFSGLATGAILRSLPYVSEAEKKARQFLSEKKKKIPEGGITQEVFKRGTEAIPWFLGGGGVGSSVFVGEMIGLAAKEEAKAKGFGEGVQTAVDIIANVISPAALERAVTKVPKIAPKTAEVIKKTPPPLPPKPIKEPPPLPPKPSTAQVQSNTGEGLLELQKKNQNPLAKIDAEAELTEHQALSRLEQESSIIRQERQDQLSLPLVSEKEAASQISKESKDTINNMVFQFEKAAEERVTKEPIHFEASEINEEMGLATEKYLLNQIHPVDMPLQESGKAIQLGINTAEREEAKVHTALYSRAEQAAEKVAYSPKETIGAVENLLGKLQKITTKGEGYSKVIETLKTALKDLGLHKLDIPERVTKFFGPQSKIYENVTVDKMIELSRRISSIIDYEVVDKKIKNLLKPMKAILDKEIVKALGGAETEGGAAYIKARETYAKHTNKYGKEAIRKIRSTETPEKLLDMISNPSELDYLKQVLSPEGIQVVERAIVKEIISKPTQTANKLLNFYGNSLSKEAQKVAREGVELGNKLTSLGSGKVFINMVLDELQSFSKLGKVPEKTLSAMRVSKGYSLIKRLLNQSENGKKIFKQLQNINLNDIYASVSKNGEIDFSKIKNVVKDPHVRQLIQDAGGKEALSFFENLESHSKGLAERFKNLEQQYREFENIKFQFEKRDSAHKLAEEGEKLGIKERFIQRKQIQEQKKAEEKLNEIERRAKIYEEKKHARLQKQLLREKSLELKKKLSEEAEAIRNKKPFLEKIFGKYADKALTVIGAAIGSSFGIKGVSILFGSYMAKKGFQALINSPRARKIVKDLSNTKIKLSPEQVVVLVKELEEMLDKED